MPEIVQQQSGDRSQRIVLFLIIIVLGVFLLYWFHGSPENGSSYDSLSKLMDEQKAAGYVQVGIFGSSWPARLIETIEGTGQVDFVRKNGTSHSYTKFDGYRMKVMRLESEEGNEVIVVLRSAEKGGVVSVVELKVVNENQWEREMRMIREERERSN